MASLSLAIDLGMNQPMERVLKACWLGISLSNALGLSEPEKRDVYYLTLLRHVGCTSTATTDAQLLGDELSGGAIFPLMDEANMQPAMRFMVSELGKELPPFQRAGLLARFLWTGPRAGRQAVKAHCEVAARFAEVFGFSPAFQDSLWHTYERWDGKGLPNGLNGEQIVAPARVVNLALDMVYYWIRDGSEAALEVARRRNGRFYDPAIVAAFERDASEWLRQMETLDVWQAVLDAEPGQSVWLAEQQVDSTLSAIADFSDLKTPFFVEHSRRVAGLAARAAESYGLPLFDQTCIRRASLLHDIGKVGISASVWNKTGPLNDLEWERVRLHPYYTERIFSRSAELAPLASLAALHHERLDGSGYHRSLPSNLLSVNARLLAAVNAYCAKIEKRPHRPALSPEEAAEELQREARRGWFDSNIVNAVLNAAGMRTVSSKRKLPADLSPRELEVLRLITRGLTNRQMAAKLVLSEKTIGRHIERLYDKIGASTRAAATLFAVQNGLLSDLED